MKLISKTNLCVMSMELIFVLVFFKSIDIPIYFGADFEFIGWTNLFMQLYQLRNIIAVCCVIGILWSESVYLLLSYRLKGSPTTISVAISKIENKDVEYLSLLFTILTVVSFNFDDTRDIVIFLIIFLLYAVLLKSTDWYTTNPLLRLRGLHLYSGVVKNYPHGITFLSFEQISSDKEIFRSYQKISDAVYWLYPESK